MGKRDLTVSTFLAIARALKKEPAELLSTYRAPTEDKLYRFALRAYLEARRTGTAPPLVWQAIEAATEMVFAQKKGRNSASSRRR